MLRETPFSVARPRTSPIFQQNRGKRGRANGWGKMPNDEIPMTKEIRSLNDEITTVAVQKGWQGQSGPSGAWHESARSCAGTTGRDETAGKRGPESALHFFNGT